MRLYICDLCGFQSAYVEDILLMGDGDTELCEPCHVPYCAPCKEARNG